MSWFHEFRNFSLFHGLTVATCMAMITLLVLMARRARHEAPGAGAGAASPAEAGSAPGRRLSEPAMRRSMAIFGLVWMAWTSAWWLLPDNFDPYESLPLHMCDLCMVLGPLAWFTGWRWATTLIVHWGLALTTQAFVTPSLAAGLASVEYWMFFVGHTIVLLAALYPVAVLGYRPGRRDLLFVLAAGLVYAAMVTPVNLVLDVNYGYVGNASPPSPTLIDLLGPWPGRVAWILLLGNGMVAVVWAVLARWPRGGRAPAAAV